MSLTNIQLASSVTWNLANSTATGFAAATESDSLQFALTNLNLTTFNQVYAASLTITPSGTSTIDLTSVVNLVAESFSFAHVLSLCVMPTGADITIGPGASNGLVWFLSSTGTTVTIRNGGLFLFSDPSTYVGQVVDGTHKTLTITNLSGADSVVVDLMVLGGTT